MAVSLQLVDYTLLKRNLSTLVALRNKGEALPLAAQNVVSYGGVLYDMSISYDFAFKCMLTVFCGSRTSNMKRIMKSLEVTQKVFDKNLLIMWEALGEWQDCIKHVANDARAQWEVKRIDEMRDLVRGFFTTWEQAVGPYLQLQSEGRGFPELQLQVHPKYVKQWQNCAELSRLEWTCDERVPLSALVKALTWSELGGNKVYRECDSASKAAIQKFCRLLNDKDSYVARKKKQQLHVFLFKAMIGLVRDVNQQHEGREGYSHIIMAGLSRILALLKSEGCTVLDKPDPTFLVWRSSIQANNQVRVGSVTIAERLGPHDATREVVYFRYQENLDVVLAIFNNSVCALLRAHERVQYSRTIAEESFVISKVEGYDDCNWRYVTFERVDSFGSVSISPERIRLFSELVRRMLWRGLSFDLMDPKYWGFVKSSLKIACKKPVKLVQNVDVLGWESLIRAFSCDRETVIRQVMTDSTLMQESISAFYCEVIQRGLSGEDVNLNSIVLNRHFRGGVVVEEILKQAQEFYIGARILHAATAKNWSEKYQRQDIADAVGQALTRAYRGLNCIAYPKERLLELAEGEFLHPSVTPGMFEGFLRLIRGT